MTQGSGLHLSPADDLEPGHPVVRAALCTEGCLAMSLASAHKMRHPPPVVTKMSLDIAEGLLGTKLPPSDALGQLEKSVSSHISYLLCSNVLKTLRKRETVWPRI